MILAWSWQNLRFDGFPSWFFARLIPFLRNILQKSFGDFHARASSPRRSCWCKLAYRGPIQENNDVVSVFSTGQSPLFCFFCFLSCDCHPCWCNKWCFSSSLWLFWSFSRFIRPTLQRCTWVLAMQQRRHPCFVMRSNHWPQQTTHKSTSSLRMYTTDSLCELAGGLVWCRDWS